MILKIIKLIMVLKLIVTSSASEEHNNSQIDILLSRIKKNPSPHKINLIVESFENLSSLATDIIQRTDQEFVCNNVDYESMAKMKSINVTSDEFESYAAQRINERVALTMGIVESGGDSTAYRDISVMLDYFRLLNPRMRDKNLHGYSIRVWVSPSSGKSDSDTLLQSLILVSCNSEIHWVSSFIPLFHSESIDQHDLYYDARYLGFDTSVHQLMGLPREPQKSISSYPHGQYLTSIHIPLPVRMHFYLLRKKNYERGISWIAILAFAGLFFTAWIFAVWAYLLGFKEQNWTFLNILTAQMGGSIEIRGRLRLSKMIYQMSIYVATFIVVTLGTDYMLEIFILRQYLPPIETIQDLAESNVDLVMSRTEYKFFNFDYPKVSEEVTWRGRFGKYELILNLLGTATTFRFEENLFISTVKMKIFLLSVLPLMDMVIGSMNNEGNTPVDDLLSCIRSNPSPYKINLIVGSFKNLSSLATGIIQRTNQEFVCNNVDYESMSKMKSINETSDEFENYATQRVNERVALTVGIVESEGDSTAYRDISVMLDYFRLLNPRMRDENLHGYSIRVWVSPSSIKSDSDTFLQSLILGSCNSEIHWVSSFIPLFHSESIDQHDLYYDARYLGFDTSVQQIMGLPRDLQKSISSDPHGQYLTPIHIPLPVRMHFYLLRKKNYERGISLTAILAFAGLFFTAWIFAVWAYLLGFKEQNWTFLNILTAQMGGSIEIRGRLRLSKMIYQMSIYVATFIVVTLGADYMMEIFILHQYLPPIEAIQDLAESNVDLVMSRKGYEFFNFDYPKVVSSLSLQRIFNRTQLVDSDVLSFCRDLTDVSDLKEFPNLCYALSPTDERLEISTSNFQIDRIREPIISYLAFIYLNEKFFLKSRLEKVINKLSGAGMFENWKRNVSHLGKPSNRMGREILEEDKQVPLQDQLWPVLAFGFPLGIVALICEFIWKLWIGETEMGRLVRAFYSEPRSQSAGWRSHFRNNSRNSR
ncbi:hypothetical protein QAD02_018324 [Eretmocerus hayati]|uniref:Uncharacterized protein n=1 Tax=Eretmocerus hayati TaxID=131215 RepID=A0ACC2PGE1_9HYME|nr:hypothetical protein QAD02_018324 [Eretmocerus hayati]